MAKDFNSWRHYRKGHSVVEFLHEWSTNKSKEAAIQRAFDHNEMDRLAHRILMDEQLDIIFSNIQEIFRLNYTFLLQLRDVVDKIKYAAHNEVTQIDNLGGLFSRFASEFQCYATYAKKHSEAAQELKDLRSKNDELRKYLEKRSADGAKMTLEGLLIAPVQRIPRYRLLLEELIKSYRGTTDEAEIAQVEALQKALSNIKNTAQFINEEIRDFSRANNLTAVENLFFEQPQMTFAGPNRSVVMHGPLLKLTLTKKKQRFVKRYVFLFSDVLAYGTIANPNLIKGLKVISRSKLTKSRSVRSVRSLGGVQGSRPQQPTGEITLPKDLALLKGVKLYLRGMEDVCPGAISSVKGAKQSLENLPEADQLAGSFKVFGRDKSIWLCAGSPAEKKMWLDKIHEVMKAQVDKKDSSFLRLRRGGNSSGDSENTFYVARHKVQDNKSWFPRNIDTPDRLMAHKLTVSPAIMRRKNARAIPLPIHLTKQPMTKVVDSAKQRSFLQNLKALGQAKVKYSDGILHEDEFNEVVDMVIQSGHPGWEHLTKATNEKKKGLIGASEYVAARDRAIDDCLQRNFVTVPKSRRNSAGPALPSRSLPKPKLMHRRKRSQTSHAPAVGPVGEASAPDRAPDRPKTRLQLFRAHCPGTKGIGYRNSPDMKDNFRTKSGPNHGEVIEAEHVTKNGKEWLKYDVFGYGHKYLPYTHPKTGSLLFLPVGNPPEQRKHDPAVNPTPERPPPPAVTPTPELPPPISPIDATADDDDDDFADLGPPPSPPPSP